MATVIPLVGARPTNPDTTPPPGNPDTPIITQSEMSTFMRDPRHWWLKYYRRLRRQRMFASVPGTGTFYHTALQSYYTGQAQDRVADPFKALETKAKAHIEELPEHAEEIAKAAGLAGVMFEGYLEWLEEESADVGLRFVGAEQQVDVSLHPAPFILRGKIDNQFVRDTDGTRVQMEHKTVGNLTDIPKTAQSNFQFLTYDLLAFLKAMHGEGERTDGVLLNMARRVWRTPRANPPFYGRHEVRHNMQELRSHYRHVVAVARRIQEARARLGAGEEHHWVVPPTVSKDSSWSNEFLPVYALLDNGADAEGYLKAEYETHDPLAHYEEDGK